MTEGLQLLRAGLREMPEGRCLAGFSGGADSTALLMLLAEERNAGRCLPEAVHVNHGLRGKESEEDEAFCRKMCSRLEIPLHVVHAELNGKEDENSCRKERFRCFREILQETGISSLVLAHNRDDLAETFLLRLIRGAGTEGLACMGSVDRRDGYVIYRPMLSCGREEIRKALQKDGIGWREDSTNESSRYLRNRIRLQLIPLMENLSAGAAGRIANAAEILSGENRLLQAEADRFLAEHSCPRRIDTEALKKVPDVLRKRILRTWWRRSVPEMEEHTLNAEKTRELAELAAAEKGKVNLPGNLFAEKGRQGMYLTGFPRIIPEDTAFKLRINEETAFGEMRLRAEASRGDPGNGITEQEVPEAFFQGCVIRTRRIGDRIRPFGMEGKRKLQDYLTDRGIDEPLRDEIPLICRGNEVLWAAGVGAGAIPRWDAQEKNIRLIWFGKMPWKRQGRK